MYQLVKRCYIYCILIVHVIETKSILMLLSMVYSTNAMLYHTNLHIVQLAIEKILSLSEMYHDTFINKKKSDRQIKHEYILFVEFMHTFLA